MSSSVTPEIKTAFDRDGYWIARDVFSREEVQAYKAECRRILADVEREAQAAGQDPKKALATGVYVGLAARSEVFRSVAGDARLVDILEAILGPHVAFLSDKVVFKSPEVHFDSPWHQDWPYWEGSHKISIWVALDDAGPDNGCLKLIPGSHKDKSLHDGDTSDGHGFSHRVRSERIDESRAVTAAIPAGSAIFFHDLTLHASHPNTSGRDRWALISTYRDAQAAEPYYPWSVAAHVVRGTGYSARPEAAAG